MDDDGHVDGEKKKDLRDTGRTHSSLMLQGSVIDTRDDSSPVVSPPLWLPTVLSERKGIATTTSNILVSKSAPPIITSPAVDGRKAKGRESVSWVSGRESVSEKSEGSIDREIGLTSSSKGRSRRGKEGVGQTGLDGSLGLMQELQRYHQLQQHHPHPHQQRPHPQQKGGTLFYVSASTNNKRQVDHGAILIILTIS